MTLEEYTEERRKRVANMTLAQARDLIAETLSHSDMELEFDKAVWMLLNCADENEDLVERIGKLIGYIDFLRNTAQGKKKSLNLLEKVIKGQLEERAEEPFINKPCISEKVCEHDKEVVIDKIRAEIEGWQEDIHDNEQEAEKYDFVFEPIYEIIDKYKAESEGE